MKYFQSIVVLFTMAYSINAYSQNGDIKEKCFTYLGKQINCSDENHTRNGYWMYFVGCDPRSKVYAEGLYINGIKSGKWIYRNRGSHTLSESEVFYTEDGAVIINIDDGKLRINSDSTLVPDYSNYSKNMYRTWCNRCFNTNFYDCFLYNNRSQTPANYKKKMVYGFYNAINEILLGYDLSDSYLDCILEKTSDYYLNKWYVESYEFN